MIEEDKDLLTIQDALVKLRDHFNEQGKVLIIGLYYAPDRQNPAEDYFGQIFSTQAFDIDRLNAGIQWCKLIAKAEEDPNSELKPWQQ